jgi:hypothetical protein
VALEVATTTLALPPVALIAPSTALLLQEVAEVEAMVQLPPLAALVEGEVGPLDRLLAAQVTQVATLVVQGIKVHTIMELAAVVLLP